MLGHRDPERANAEPLLPDKRALFVADALRDDGEQHSGLVIMQQQHSHVGMGESARQL
jgi:hypothetical protein